MVIDFQDISRLFILTEAVGLLSDFLSSFLYYNAKPVFHCA
ncbi:hypothetical protein Hsw_2800 [Hymenobacter swuensis DY53]|uniref:Uncharacterized protein n=1 Tax=Hymenobacter swuensis DY53 TaxID=1227739 RepID=W8F9L4_9BACT|nr:hypothetical protein Hsw_2800 [Hymenobacter swuensis DY53]